MLNSLIKLILAVFLFQLSISVYGQMAFVENKGQWPEQVEFRLSSTLHQVYFEKNAFTFNLIAGEDYFGSSVHHGHHAVKPSRLEKVKAHAYKMVFLDANNDVKVLGRHAQAGYENFFIGNNPEKWAKEVKRYQEIYYQELYSSIDLRIYEQANGFKYDFIVKPNGSVDEIQMQFEGVNRFTISNGELRISTSVGKVTELKPYVYQFINGKAIEVEAEYVLQNKILSYNIIGEYNDSYDLIIDPSLIFSTYSGATTDNWGFTATSDKLGNVYSGGIIFNTGYPATVGAYQYDFAGGEPNSTVYLGCDITISKYNPDGTTLLWATYLGGTASEEMPHSLVVNEFNDLIVFGTTGSTDYPTTLGAYDNSFNGGTLVIYDGVVKYTSGTDIIVSKLSADGTQLLGSTFVGGSENDGLNYRESYSPYLMHGNDSLYYNYADGARGEVIVDAKSDIFVGTSTFSNDFPTVNGFQLNSNGQQEGVVFKLSADLTQMIWSSYLGGSHDDAIYSLEINEDGETYVAGGTVSSNFPTTAGAYQTTFQGGTTDGFVAHINTVGNTLLASTYFGSPAYDQAYFVRRDRFNNVYITGQTEASGTTLIHNAIYNNPSSGQFITKFFPGLTAIDWSTTFGTGNGKPNISISAFAVDVCERIYLSGWGREWGGYAGFPWGSTFGTVGMDITVDAEQSVTDGQDFYIMVMFGDASALDYGTFFGEQHYGNGYCGHDHVDGGTSRFDRMGNIYQSVCASCGNVGLTTDNSSCNEFPTTTGAYAEDNGGYPGTTWNCNNAVFRFSFAEDITVADFFADPLACESTLVHFTNTGISTNYYWDFGDGSPIVADENPDHLYDSPGTYDVMLWTIDSNTCNITDTITRSITIQDQISQDLGTTTICLGEEVQIGVSSETNHTYDWTPTNGLSNSYISNPMASPTVSTDYILIIDDGICIDTVWQTVEVIDIQYQMQGLSDTIICEGDMVELIAIYDTAVDSVHWSSNSSFSDVLNPTGSDNIFVSPTTNQDYYVQTFDSICQIQRQDTVTVQIDIPEINIIGDPMLCLSDTVDFSVQLLSGTISNIQWEPSSVIISGQGSSAVEVSANSSFWLSAEVENTRFCTVKDSVYITVADVQVSYTKTDLLCHNVCTGAIVLDYTGISPFTFAWSNSLTGDTISNLCADTYFVTVTDSLGCSDITQIDVLQPPALVTLISDTTNTGCGIFWNIGSATVSVVGGTQPYTYLWSNGDATAVADSLNVGTYYVTVEDANGCTSILSIEIDDPSDLEVSSQSIPISCYGECDASAYLIIIAESLPPYTYQWSTGSTLDSIYDLCAGSYQYTVSDANDCKRAQTVSFIEPAQIVANIDAAAQACHGDITTAMASGMGGIPPYTYLWSDGQITETAVGLVDGTYSVIITDLHDCVDSTTVNIQSPELIVYDTLKTEANCEVACNGTAELQVTGGQAPYSYLWDNGSTESTADNLCFGKHTVSLTDANGCFMQIEITININPDGIPVEATSNPYSIFKGASSQLSSTIYDGYTYDWQPQEAISDASIPNPITTPFSTTVYQVNVIDSFGCTGSDTTIVYVRDVICDEPFIYVPNAFSPNDDGENDILYVRGEMIEELQFSVYNRWGELVFNTTSINHGWDGVYEGKKVDPAVFVYHLTATCVNKDVFKKKGNITVVK